jgi:hypothetical protein
MLGSTYHLMGQQGTYIQELGQNYALCTYL